MSDARLRELQRRARAGRADGDVQRAARELCRSGQGCPVLEKAAAGHVGLPEVELAAYLGEPGPLALLDHEAVTYAAFVGDTAAVHVVLRDEVTHADLAAWLPGLLAWGEARLVGAMVAGADVALAALPERLERDGTHPPEEVEFFAQDRDYVNMLVEQWRAALRAARAWVRCPCERHRSETPEPQTTYLYEGAFVPAESAIGAIKHPGGSFDPWETRARRWCQDVANARVPAERVRAAIVDELRP